MREKKIAAKKQMITTRVPGKLLALGDIQTGQKISAAEIAAPAANFEIVTTDNVIASNQISAATIAAPAAEFTNVAVTELSTLGSVICSGTLSAATLASPSAGFTNLAIAGTANLGAATATSLNSTAITVGSGGIAVGPGGTITGDSVSAADGSFEDLSVVGTSNLGAATATSLNSTAITVGSGGITLGTGGIFTVPTAGFTDITVTNTASLGSVICSGALSAATIAAPSGGFTDITCTGTATCATIVSSGSVTAEDCIIASLSADTVNCNNVTATDTLATVDVISSGTITAAAINTSGSITSGSITADSITVGDSVSATDGSFVNLSVVGVLTAATGTFDNLNVLDTLTLINIAGESLTIPGTITAANGDVAVTDNITAGGNLTATGTVSGAAINTPNLVSTGEQVYEKNYHYTGGAVRTSITPTAGIKRQIIVDEFTDLSTTAWNLNDGNSLGISKLTFFLVAPNVDGDMGVFSINCGIDWGSSHSFSEPYGVANSTVTKINPTDYTISVNGFVGLFTLVLGSGSGAGTLKFASATSGITKVTIERIFI